MPLYGEKRVIVQRIFVTTLIANTKGEGKGGDEFWEKAEKLLYSALIGYIHYEAPEEEQNFTTLLEMINEECSGCDADEKCCEYAERILKELEEETYRE